VCRDSSNTRVLRPVVPRAVMLPVSFFIPLSSMVSSALWAGPQGRIFLCCPCIVMFAYCYAVPEEDLIFHLVVSSTLLFPPDRNTGEVLSAPAMPEKGCLDPYFLFFFFFQDLCVPEGS